MGLNVWIHICDHCNERLATIYDDDPYIAELHPESENEETWWCEECYQESLWDI